MVSIDGPRCSGTWVMPSAPPDRCRLRKGPREPIAGPGRLRRLYRHQRPRRHLAAPDRRPRATAACRRLPTCPATTRGLTSDACLAAALPICPCSLPCECSNLWLSVWTLDCQLKEFAGLSASDAALANSGKSLPPSHGRPIDWFHQRINVLNRRCRNYRQPHIRWIIADKCAASPTLKLG
jgi:hypothetical protein